MKPLIAWMFSGLLLGICPDIFGTVYYVDGDNGSDGSNGTSWAAAWKTVTNALNKAGNPSEIWIKAGLCYPTADGDRTKSFVMKAGVDVYGGFAGTETVRDQRDWTANRTVFSGDIGVAGDAADNSYHVVVGASARIDGCVIQDGRASGTGANAKGGGMYTSGAYPITANCIFSNNLAIGGVSGGYEGGGGVYWYQGTYTACTVGWYNCTFDANVVAHTNESAFGGGLYMGFTTNTVGAISNCLFKNNIATGVFSRAAALYLLDTTQRSWTPGTAFEVVDCVFSNNASYQYFPGAVYVNQFVAPVVFRDCRFTANRNYQSGSAGNGGAMGISVNASGQGLQMNGCQFDGNVSGNQGGAVVFLTSGGTNSFWRQCSFINNVSVSHGGAIYGVIDGTFDTCTFISNSCSGAGVGGAVAPNGYGSVTNDVFTNCTFTANTVGSGSGGAMYLYHPVTLLDCVFEGNSSAIGSGGAIFGVMPAGTATLINRCAFTSNGIPTTATGGAIAYNSGELTLQACLFTQNIASNYGGAIWSPATLSPLATDCQFISNKTVTYYGGAWHSTGPSRVMRSVFVGNMASNGYGGGLCFRDFTTKTGLVANCVFRDNRAKYGGAIATLNAHASISNVTAVTNVSLMAGYGGALCHATATYTCLVANCIFWDNSPVQIQPLTGVTCTYSCVKGGFTGTGNVAADPLFADPVFLHVQSRTGTYGGGYFSGGTWQKASAFSPTLDAGDPASGWSQEPAPNGGRINMGAYGNTDVASKSRLLSGTVINIR